MKIAVVIGRPDADATPRARDTAFAQIVNLERAGTNDSQI